MIPVNEPKLGAREKERLLECIDSGWISSEGPFVSEFEERMAGQVGRAHGIAVANGTAALEIAVAALGIGPGDEVILPAFTIISCAGAVVRSGATPVLVDSDPVTWNMDPEQVADAVTERTRAIMAVHIYGLPVSMGPLLELADRYGLAVIEDAAEAIGQTWQGRPCGGIGTISTFSFYPNKHVTTGEGGMVLTDDPDLAELCRSLRNLSFGREKRFEHERLGWNYRMTNMQAAVGLSQLERLEETLVRKRAIGHRYWKRLSQLEKLQLPALSTSDADNLFWVFGIIPESSPHMTAEALGMALKDRGVGTRPFFWPMHRQPVFRNMGLFLENHHPVAERLGEYGLYLPSGITLTDAEIDTVCAAVEDILT